MARIVYIDDEPLITRAAARTLRPRGHEVETFTDPDEAIAAILANPPDLVITDNSMGAHKNGFDVAAAVYTVTRVLLVTGDTNAAARIVDAINSGHLATFLMKPVATSRMIETVDWVLQKPLKRQEQGETIPPPEGKTT